MTYARGRFTVAGADRGLGLFEIPGELAVVRDNEMHEPVFPNGCHVCEVEVDPETGAVRLVRYAAVDDVGRAVNPLIVEGQTLTGAMMDYAVPRAAGLPSFATRLNEVPSPTIADALAQLGVTDIPIPATPSAIWRAIRQGRAGAARTPPTC